MPTSTLSLYAPDATKLKRVVLPEQQLLCKAWPGPVPREGLEAMNFQDIMSAKNVAPVGELAARVRGNCLTLGGRTEREQDAACARPLRTRGNPLVQDR
jgi:hypothetical protein